MVIFVKQEKAYKAEALRLLFLILSLTLSLYSPRRIYQNVFNHSSCLVYFTLRYLVTR